MIVVGKSSIPKTTIYSGFLSYLGVTSYDIRFTAIEFSTLDIFNTGNLRIGIMAFPGEIRSAGSLIESRNSLGTIESSIIRPINKLYPSDRNGQYYTLYGNNLEKLITELNDYTWIRFNTVNGIPQDIHKFLVETYPDWGIVMVVWQARSNLTTMPLLGVEWEGELNLSSTFPHRVIDNDSYYFPTMENNDDFYVSTGLAPDLTSHQEVYRNTLCIAGIPLNMFVDLQQISDKISDRLTVSPINNYLFSPYLSSFKIDRDFTSGDLFGCVSMGVIGDLWLDQDNSFYKTKPRILRDIVALDY